MNFIICLPKTQCMLIDNRMNEIVYKTRTMVMVKLKNNHLYELFVTCFGPPIQSDLFSMNAKYSFLWGQWVTKSKSSIDDQ